LDLSACSCQGGKDKGTKMWLNQKLSQQQHSGQGNIKVGGYGNAAKNGDQNQKKKTKGSLVHCKIPVFV